MSTSALLFNDIDIMERTPFFLHTIAELTTFRSINKICHSSCSNHMEYHTIKCTLGNNDLWRRLVDRPGLALRVRAVEICPEVRAWGPPEAPLFIIPPTLQAIPKPNFENDPDELNEAVLERTRTSERLLIEALKGMKNLDSFNWDAYPPLIMASPSNEAFGKATDDIWSVLQRLPLRSVRAVDLTVDSYVPDWRCKASPLLVTSGVFDFEGLEKFEMSMPWKEPDDLHLGRDSSAYVPGAPRQLGGDGDEAEDSDEEDWEDDFIPQTPDEIHPASPLSRYSILTARLKRLIDRNPNLKSLVLYLQNSYHGYRLLNVNDVFRRWRSSGLRRLSLWGFHVDTDILTDIIVHHPELEELRYMTATEWDERYQVQLANFKLPVGSIPKLRSFQGPREIKAIIEEIRDQKMVTEKGHENYGNPGWEFKSADRAMGSPGE